MKPISLGVYEKSMPNEWTIAQKLTLSQQADFDYMEISIDETDEKLERLTSNAFKLDTLSAIQSTGQPIRTMCLSGHRKYPLGSTDAVRRMRSLDIMQRAIDLSCEIGVRIIQLAGYDVYYESSSELTQAYFAENLQKCVEMAASCGVILAFETMETPFMNTVSKAMRYVSLLHSPYLQVYPDIGNVRNATDHYLEDLQSGDGHIAAAHLKETVADVYRDMQFGEGRVDFDGCIHTLKTMGVRMFTCEFWYDGQSEPLPYLQRTRTFFRTWF